MDHLTVLRDILLGTLDAEIENGEWDFTDAEIIAALHLAAAEWSRDYLDRHVYIYDDIEIEYDDDDVEIGHDDEDRNETDETDGPGSKEL